MGQRRVKFNLRKDQTSIKTFPADLQTRTDSCAPGRGARRGLKRLELNETEG